MSAKPKAAPSRSWWQDAPPDRFTQLAEQEAPRMRVSTFGRIIGTQMAFVPNEYRRKKVVSNAAYSEWGD